MAKFVTRLLATGSNPDNSQKYKNGRHKEKEWPTHCSLPKNIQKNLSNAGRGGGETPTHPSKNGSCSNVT